MKRLKLMIATALASVALCFGFGFSPVNAFAEESAETREIFVETVLDEEVIEETENVENSAVFEQKTYVWEKDAEKIELTLLSEKNAEATMYYYDAYYATLSLTYTYIESDVVELYQLNGSYLETFRLHPNGYLINYDDGVYIPPDINEEIVEDDKEITYDDILALMGSIAEKEGFKNEWDKTLYYIQTAASAKKVDTMIILIVCVLVFLVIYASVKLVRYKLLKRDTTKKDIKAINSKLDDVGQSSGAQTKAINGLIDEAGRVEGVAADGVRREKAMANALAKQNVAIRCLIRGTNIKQDLKDEAFRSLNESDELCDEAKREVS